ncbi:P-loop containing nucleoside triphosphate hydrolase protein [Cristinia sonorae]|uniref:P-loop containing nucleoside triphosphate hydrolase protein n=1 Tax=Cristinia sonorae TaxID=1940300 RepID=A0A8K0UGU3_9AGAR|nr:P-loop containing nucleoside triphosphate hydrolase protein [Cristinia sonorae]
MHGSNDLFLDCLRPDATSRVETLSCFPSIQETISLRIPSSSRPRHPRPLSIPTALTKTTPMDFDDFELDGLGELKKPTLASADAALDFLNERWYSLISRRGRTMDLIGDYAGSELFLIDGNSLLQEILDDDLLALARKSEVSFQILHAIHALEQVLENFQRRDATFEIAFWEDTRHLVLSTGGDIFQYASRLLARTMLMKHLATTNISLHVFGGVEDPKWHEYLRIKRPMFIMLNDGSTVASSAEVTLLQRSAMFTFISQGVAIAILHGAIFRDSKISTLVMEQRQDKDAAHRFAPDFWGCVKSAARSLKRKEDELIVKALGAKSKTPSRYVRTSGASDGLHAALIATAYIYKVNHAGDLPRTAELLYAFIAHCFILPGLSVEERAQPMQPAIPDLEHLIREVFLPHIFLALRTQIETCLVDIDGRVFTSLLVCLLKNPHSSLEEIIGADFKAQVDDVWCKFDLPSVDFSFFATQYIVPSEPSPPASSRTSVPKALGILPFSNPTFDDILGSVDIDVEDTHYVAPGSRFGFNERFVDKEHWHSHRHLLPRHLSGESEPMDAWQRMKQLRRDQNFKKQLQWHAKTLTGAFGVILEPIVITPGQSSKDTGVPPNRQSHTRKQPKKEHISSAEKIRRANLEKKQADADKANLTWWTRELTSLTNMTTTQKITRVEALQRNERRAGTESWLAVMLRLYDLNLQFLLWLEHPDAIHSEKVRDTFTTSIVSRVKSICELGGLWPSAMSQLRSILTALGFSRYTPSLVEESPNQSAVDRKFGFVFARLDEFMRITEHPVVWQLRVFGEYMDRSMDSQSDSRVSFKPDAWQRKVLDCLDANESVLVVAPTSAGKTFISYYAMEKVLRGSDRDILVYIAPTKALVTQIAAEVYGRFSKNFTSGRSCWAIHTRDYRINSSTNCQILITVPEILATMLLSPALARVWTPYIKWIILDEIHTIGQSGGGEESGGQASAGAVWEQILLLAPCPIIGLSATIGHPERFNAWLESVQQQHGYKHTFIHHPHRYSHLRKFTYLMQDDLDPTAFPGLEKYTESSNIKFLHPVSLLSAGIRNLPPDFSLEARDCLSLYYALHALRSELSIDISDLKPSRFFKKGDLLRQKDILAYEAQLKEVLTRLIKESDPREVSSPVQKVVQTLQDVEVSRRDAIHISEPGSFFNNLLYLLSDLHAKGDLPALLFQFDRQGCEAMLKHLLHNLESSERTWRETSPVWATKIRKWKIWQNGERERERQAEKAAKRHKKADEEEGRIDATTTWEETFEPNDPSPQFSFVGRSAYTKADLEESLGEIARAGIPQWALDGLRRGIAVHHSGMNKAYRSLVESLYRLGFVRVIICTGTLALGINAPTRTSVFCGDSPFLTALMYRQCGGRAGRRGFDLLGRIVFYGLAMDRVQRLVLSRLPSLGGSFPMTSTLVLRLFNLLEGSNNSPFAAAAIRNMLQLPHISFTSDIGRDQLLHHTRFSIDYLRRSGLLDANGHPIDLFGIAAHLYYTEPSNLALVALLRHGVIHRICNQTSMINAQRDFMLIMCHLFGRRDVPSVYSSSKNVKELIRKSPSMVILPPLPAKARTVLQAHNAEILRIFSGYALNYASQDVDETTVHTLPVSGRHIPKSNASRASEVNTVFYSFLQRGAVRTAVRSPFVANSGHDDTFTGIPELTKTAKRGLHLNDHAIPSLHRIVPPSSESASPLNAYLLDYFIHGQKQALTTVNGIRGGDLWYLLQDFTLTLKAVRSTLEKLLLGDAAREDEDEEDTDPAEMVGDVATEGEVSGRAVGSTGKKGAGNGRTEEVTVTPVVDRPKAISRKPQPGTGGPQIPPRPPGVSDANWRVFLVVHTVTEEFEAKFRTMWA